ncbi:hypothetical protein BLA29_014764 [Euroglyphus maynei]|uniref:Uncharacterized protein n=1 Tax=Euroglyphus maynei TaxID=6958 RepID=A0A1Y3ALZ9_EURMA|nr:hypothetical protein BLA29_014764 [Euroglyphus maynei]
MNLVVVVVVVQHLHLHPVAFQHPVVGLILVGMVVVEVRFLLQIIQICIVGLLEVIVIVLMAQLIHYQDNLHK